MATQIDFLGDPIFQAVDGDGVPIAGGLLWCYTAETNTLQNMYSTINDATNQINPIDNPKTLDSAGRASIVYRGASKFVLENSDVDPDTGHGSVIWTADNVGLNTADTFPSGFLADFAGGTVPSGWLLCDGSAVSRVTYASLFAAISTRWGSGDGSTTFNLPNLARRTKVGSGGAGSGTLSNTVGSTGGSETHTLTTPEIPAHTHSYTTNNAVVAINVGATTNVLTQPTSGATTGSTGGGGAHNNMQPSAVVLMIIKI